MTKRGLGNLRSLARQIYDSSDGPRRTVLQELAAPPEWNRIASALAAKSAKSSTVIVCGPKSSGKSTFSRLLANRLLTDETRLKSKTPPRVAFLDIDPGQPEFSTPGTLSLVHLAEPILSAAPFCHPYADNELGRTVRSHTVASVSPATDPQHYIECVLDLYAAYHKLPRCPLVVNASGWIQGTGLVVLTELIAKLHPTDVIYMSEDGPEETVEGLEAASRNVPITQLPSQPSEYTSRTALHLRTMQTMSYFHLNLAASTGEFLRWDASPLVSKPPLSVRFTGENRGILAVVCYDYQPPIELVAETINGALVSIVEIEDKAAFRGLQAFAGGLIAEDPTTAMDLEGDGSDRKDDMEATEIARSPEGLPVLRNPNGGTIDPRYSRVIGTALVRGIDTAKGELQILTPVPLVRIEAAARNSQGIVLVSGKLDPPSWAYTEDLHNRSFDSGSKDAGADDSVELTDEETDDDRSEKNGEGPTDAPEHCGIPWVERLHGNQRRAVGSRVWRVRRDLGRSGTATD